MKVVAKEVGYYGGQLRAIGESFVIADKSELGRWMIPAGDDEAAKVAEPKAAKPKAAKPTKAELVAQAVAVGAHVTPDTMTNDQIVEAIKAAEADDAEGSDDVLL